MASEPARMPAANRFGAPERDLLKSTSWVVSWWFRRTAPASWLTPDARRGRSAPRYVREPARTRIRDTDLTGRRETYGFGLQAASTVPKPGGNGTHFASRKRRSRIRAVEPPREAVVVVAQRPVRVEGRAEA